MLERAIASESIPTPAPPQAALPELAPARRFLAVLAAWLLLFLATPGLIHADGSLLLAALALVPWALASSRPGPRAFLVEWLAAALGLSALTFWSVNVLWLTLLAVAIVPAAYMAAAGVVLRRLAPRWPLAIAAPSAWIALETLSGIVEPPLGFTWMRLGHHAHAHAALLAPMRVVGVAGVGFALAALAGGAADLLRARARGTLRGAIRGAPAVAGLGPLAIALALGIATSPPATVDGPAVLLVQPAFEARRKQKPPAPGDLLREVAGLTRQGLAEARAAGVEPDLIAWGETVLPFAIGEPGLLEAFDRGVRAAPWGQHQLTRKDVQTLLRNEREVVGERLFGADGGARVVPPGTVFLSGVEEYVERDGRLRRTNAVVVWGEGGQRLGRGAKVHLVPGGETMVGLERIAWVRDTAHSLAGYVPDLVADERAGVVEIPLRDGRRVRAGLSVCFDNAYEDPYAEPLRRGRLDLHVIASNEAWYLTSWEYDQMVAFSRCIAAATARSVLRTTNSGISLAIGPDGREIARVRSRSGADRMEPATALVRVPVPDGDPGPTLFARTEALAKYAWVLLPAALWLLRRPGRAVTGSP